MDWILEAKLNKKVRTDDGLKFALAIANDVKVDSITRWLRNDDTRLTTKTNIELITNHFKLNEETTILFVHSPYKQRKNRTGRAYRCSRKKTFVEVAD